MTKKSGVSLSDFINNDRFELNSYLTYLFNQFQHNTSAQSEKELTKQSIQY
ncbi:hypothetical protein ABET51_13135 [Metabacillus fastidiosus]|uniref:hypothetical protein n=1 Tax=Metabacillus fastidiosus TaxID=1458 RepID=UPI002E22BCD7|nr:hypothetical protein [Metabacillus fastidiosus]